MDLNVANNKCCGCSACADVCPKNAIIMTTDDKGFVVPQIDKERCIWCGQCQRVCQFISPIDLFNPIKAYAAVSDDNEAIIRSASGGVFYSIANSILEDGGAVVGCAYDKKDDKLNVCHIAVQSTSDLAKLQGSKYVQSNTVGIYKKVKQLASSNRPVLFSGTPCQVAACKLFLGNRFDNVYYVDIICHGVPSLSLFKAYISYLEEKHRIQIEEVLFRDKTKGWDLRGSIFYRKKDLVYKKSFRTGGSSYYALFLKGQTYRDSCYECPYARKERSGDITIGDYWGIEREHPEFLKNNGGDFDEKKGVSCIIVNSNKGKKLIDEYGNNILKKSTDLISIIQNNTQLREPSKKGNNRDKLLEVFVKQGYEAFDKHYHKALGLKDLLYRLYALLPSKKV